MRLARWSGIWIATLLVSYTMAWAAPRAPETAESTDQAQVIRSHYERGIRFYQLGQFASSITEFNAAYELSHRPDLLFDLAQAYRQLGELESALAAYRDYLAQQPSAPNRVEVEVRIVDLDHVLADRKPAAKPVAPTLRAPHFIATADAPALADSLDHARVTRRNAFITSLAAMAVVGTVSLGVAAGLSVRAANDANALRNAPIGSALANRYDDGRQATNASYALYMIGGTVLIAGLVTAIVSRHSLVLR